MARPGKASNGTAAERSAVRVVPSCWTMPTRANLLIHAAANSASFFAFFAFRRRSINESTFWRMVWKEQIWFRNVARNAAILANNR